MHQILPIMLFGNPIKFTLLCSVFLALRSDYSLMMLKLFLRTFQELMSAAKWREGASNCRTLFVPSSVESHALNFG